MSSSDEEMVDVAEVKRAENKKSAKKSKIEPSAPVKDTRSINTDTLPWVEKYRPKEFSELIAHTDIISTLQRLIDQNQLPHLLLYGPPGTGKTSTILTCARQMYKSHFQSMVLELNASDDRGIDVVRDQIKDFASTKTIFSSGIKLVILDEADNMTQVAQAALRRVIEKYTKSTRFCLICNYVSKISPALQSRCTRFRFGPLPKEAVVKRLQHVIENEGLQNRVDKKGLEALLKLGEGGIHSSLDRDMRKSLNILQSTSMAYDKIGQEAVYQCTGTPQPQDIQQAVEWLLNEDYSEAYKRVQALQVEKGLALQDMVREMHLFVVRLGGLRAETMTQVLVQLSEVEGRLLQAASDRVQLAALVAAFQLVREAETAE